jgi:spore coat protein U-like protein
MNSVRWGLVALALLAGMSHTAAGTVTTNLQVQVTLLVSCTVLGNTLDFGQVEAGQGSGERTRSHVKVSCPRGAAFQVGINDGTHAQSGQRRMKHDTSFDFLSYEIYKFSIGNDRFGDAIISQRVGGTGQGPFIYNVIPLYGEILAGQSPPPGSYLDNAVITVYF